MNLRGCPEELAEEERVIESSPLCHSHMNGREGSFNSFGHYEVLVTERELPLYLHKDVDQVFVGKNDQGIREFTLIMPPHVAVEFGLIEPNEIPE